MSRGLKNTDNDGLIYLNMSKGLFVKRVPEPTELSRERALTKGDNIGTIVHEERFEKVTGQLVDIKVDTHELYGKSWEFHMDIGVESQEIAVVKLNYSSGYATNILSRILSIDTDKDITLQGYNFRPKDSQKDRVGISIYQDGKKIESLYTRKNPNGLPELKKLIVKGNAVYDDTERLEFFQEIIDLQVIPALRGSESVKEDAGEPEGGQEIGEDGLPF